MVTSDGNIRWHPAVCCLLQCTNNQQVRHCCHSIVVLTWSPYTQRDWLMSSYIWACKPLTSLTINHRDRTLIGIDRSGARGSLTAARELIIQQLVGVWQDGWRSLLIDHFVVKIFNTHKYGRHPGDGCQICFHPSLEDFIHSVRGRERTQPRVERRYK